MHVNNTHSFYFQESDITCAERLAVCIVAIISGTHTGGRHIWPYLMWGCVQSSNTHVIYVVQQQNVVATPEAVFCGTTGHRHNHKRTPKQNQTTWSICKGIHCYKLYGVIYVLFHEDPGTGSKYLTDGLLRVEMGIT